MRNFVTGAPGSVGSALVPDLIEADHQVLGLTRSEAGSQALRAAGPEVKHGNIEDLDSLRDGAAQSDGVIHLAFNHDFSQFQQNRENDRKAIEAIGEALEGSRRPSSSLRLRRLRPTRTASHRRKSVPPPRAASEAAAKELTARYRRSFVDLQWIPASCITAPAFSPQPA